MDFTISERQREWLGRVQSFIKNHVRPAVPIYRQQDEEGARWKVIPIVEDLKKKARAEGVRVQAIDSGLAVPDVIRSGE